MLTLFMLLAAAGGILRLALAWLLKQRWGVSIGVPQALAGALVVLAGLPELAGWVPSNLFQRGRDARLRDKSPVGRHLKVQRYLLSSLLDRCPNLF